MDRPPKFQLADMKLGGGLEELITSLRDRKPRPVSYTDIAFEIADRTGIRVTGQTVANWHDLVTDSPADETAGAA